MVHAGEDSFPSVLELQVRTSKMLALGFTFTVVTLPGIGSLLAFIIGLKGWRIINKSEGQIGGRLMAWWCIIVGGVELLWWVITVMPLLMRHAMQWSDK